MIPVRVKVLRTIATVVASIGIFGCVMGMIYRGTYVNFAGFIIVDVSVIVVVWRYTK